MRILGEEISVRFLLVNFIISFASLSFTLLVVSYSIYIVLKAFEGW